jgi:hypothetical protein
MENKKENEGLEEHIVAKFDLNFCVLLFPLFALGGTRGAHAA